MTIRLQTLSTLLITTILFLGLSSCGLFGSNDDGGPSLNGDLSWRIKGQADMTLTVSRAYYDGSSVNASPLRSYGLSEGSVSGDLEDGDYKAYRLQATPFGGAPPSGSVTLQLLNDGKVIKKTSEPNENDTWMVTVGEFPDGSNR